MLLYIYKTFSTMEGMHYDERNRNNKRNLENIWSLLYSIRFFSWHSQKGYREWKSSTELFTANNWSSCSNSGRPCQQKNSFSAVLRKKREESLVSFLSSSFFIGFFTYLLIILFHFLYIPNLKRLLLLLILSLLV